MFGLTSIIIACVFALCLVTFFFYKKIPDKAKAAFAALVQAWATIILVAVTWIYVIEVRNTGKPQVGVTAVQFTRVLKDTESDTYDGVQGVEIRFVIENTGSRPAKNCRISTKGKIADTTLPYTDRKWPSGVPIFPGVKIANRTTIGKEILNKLVLGKEKLIYTVNISYSDWEGRQPYSYPQSFQVTVLKKEPLALEASLVPEE